MSKEWHMSCPHCQHISRAFVYPQTPETQHYFCPCGVYWQVTGATITYNCPWCGCVCGRP